MNELLAGENLLVAGASMMTVLVAVFLHQEVLNYMYHWLPALGGRPRPRMTLLVLVIFTVHTVEIWLFAGVYWLLLVPADLGTITSENELPTLFDLLYFSASTYTTVGYGDITVMGPVRILAGTEGLLGLVLITWSASFTFFELQRHWHE